MSCTVCSDVGERGRPCPKCGRQYVAPIPQEGLEVVASARVLLKQLKVFAEGLTREVERGHITVSDGGLLSFNCQGASAMQLMFNTGVFHYLQLALRLDSIANADKESPPPPLPREFVH